MQRFEAAGMGRIPSDVLLYLLQWLRALGRREDHMTLYSCTLVRRAWAFMVLWRDVLIHSEMRKVLPRFVATVKHHPRDGRVGLAPADSYVRAIRLDTWPLSDVGCGFLLSTVVHYLPNLRCVRVRNAYLSLACLACLFQSCPNLVIFSFHGEILDYLDLGREDFRKTDCATVAITAGIHRSQLLQFDTDDINVVTAVHSATGPNLVSWTATLGAVGQVAANFPNLKMLFGDYNQPWSESLTAEHIATIAAGWRHHVAVDLSGGEDFVTDDAAHALLRYCPAIKELNLITTAATRETIHALKAHRPLKLLALGNHSFDQYAHEIGLFADESSDIALGELLIARAASLTRLRIGGPGWRMGADLVLLLPDSAAHLRSLHLVGNHSVRSFAWLTHRLPALCYLEIDDPEELKASILPACAGILWPGFRRREDAADWVQDGGLPAGRGVEEWADSFGEIFSEGGVSITTGLEMLLTEGGKRRPWG
ncbi:hypothetical protein BDK51DRAFT_46942 [Blyttiomyces helicus]|uniref:Uncharacterized protein n=1 Tax=Blyttiomyces helicus TaxID=388810 RepID=A0A4V1IPH4_9FUNG|nr:hypothetical protein BDK51DRAFT_46942 [Blyttiomyces helicus]|eukprot:RKO83067.1 hypothetical protein BDK51DRAFT_46942 [Blyttiomyces helicus]